MKKNNAHGKFSYSVFTKNVLDTICGENMILSGERVVVAVSGGADSVALLNVLLRIRKKVGFDVLVANADHGIRGEKSKKDSEFVKCLAKEYGVPYEHGELDLEELVRCGISLEEAARKARYDFLVRVAKKTNSQAIATGHNINDQAETLLLRFVWGTTLAGLSGIYPVRHERGIKIIRPLVETSREDIMDFLNEISCPYRIDETNSDPAFRRNKVRQELLPLMQRMNPNVLRSISSMAESIRDDYSFLKKVKKEICGEKSMAVPEEFSLSELLLLPKAVRRELFKCMYEKAGGTIKKLRFLHWKKVDNLIRRPKEGASLNMPDGITTGIKGGRLYVRAKRRKEI